MAFKTQLRVRTGEAPETALRQYDELCRQGVLRAVVFAETERGKVTILGQAMRPFEVAQMLVTAMQVLAEHIKHGHHTKREPLQMPDGWGEIQGPALSDRAITLDDEGTMVPPAGETVISCGECHHPRFYVLMSKATGNPARLSCAHCGNEIVFHEIRGTA